MAVIYCPDCKKEMSAGAPYTLGFGAVIILINPLLNSRGQTVLFTFFGRNYTLQALIYGAVLAGIFICSINWFTCLGKVLDSDKILFLRNRFIKFVQNAKLRDFFCVRPGSVYERF